MKKVVAMMLSLVLALGLMAGCGQKDAGTAGGTKTIESLKIAFSPYADADQITTATEPLEALLKAKLLEKGYEVYGLMRRKSVVDYGNVDHIKEKIHFIYADMTDEISLIRAMQISQADEVYNLAAQSFVATSWEQPMATAEIDALGVTKMLEAIKFVKPSCRFYQASTSEMFGLVQEMPQTEKTPFYPRSPYGVAKLYGHWITKNYRESFNLFACSGILFNHESERRGETFVTRKITLAAARIVQGKQDCLYLGNLDSLRDWGYAKDYVECMWLILQQDKPQDFVIATGVQHTVREFATLAFHYAGIELRWEGEGIDEKGIDAKTGKVLVAVSEDFYRPTDVVNLWGDPTKAKNELGWNPQSTSFEELVKIMVSHDMQKVAAEHVANVMRTNLAEYLEKGIVK